MTCVDGRQRPLTRVDVRQRALTDIDVRPLAMFDGGPATPRTEGTPTTTQFLAYVYCGQTGGWMKTPIGTEVDLGPGHIVLDGVPALRQTGTEPLPSFRSMSIVVTVVQLSYC